MAGSAEANSSTCDFLADGDPGTPSGSVPQEVEQHEATLLLLLGFGGFSVVLAFVYNVIRRYVFRDVNSLDTSFDAGGRVSVSLTAVTVGVQLLWPADLLQSASVTAQMGIAAGFWYSTMVMVNIMLFPLLSLKFKTRAPGAKTFLQVIKARFGKRTHLVFCGFAFVTNTIVLTAIIIGAGHVFQALVKDMSEELSAIIVATLFGSYSFVGGLGSTFYVSYFNAFTVFVILAAFIVRVFYLPVDSLPFGDLDTVYERIRCLQGPQDNLDRSYVTFWSADAMVWMVQGMFIAAGVTYCDQASWQSRIAAKPMNGVLGFFGATLLWFAVPTTIGTTSAIAYLSYTAGNASLTLPVEDVHAGLVVPYVAQVALGRAGAFMVLTMFTMLMMSTGSGEVMAVSSIVVYDVIQAYIYPFKSDSYQGRCVLCNKPRKEETAATVVIGGEHYACTSEECCSCPSVEDCDQCNKDQEAMSNLSGFYKQLEHYQCTIHGRFRTYQDVLVQMKSWTILWVSVCLVPFGMLVIRSGINLYWVLLTGATIVVPSFPGIVLSVVWVKATGEGLVIGGLTGLMSGIIVTLSSAATLPGGLGNFVVNTSESYTVLAGSCTSFFATLFVTIIASLLTHRIKTDKDALVEWQKVRDIDNPLNPWINVYQEEFPDLSEQERPSYQQLEQTFRKAKLAAIVGSVIGITVFAFFIPGVMASLHVLNKGQFTSWVMAMHVWCFVTAAIVIVVTPLEEIRAICTELKRRRADRTVGVQNVE